MNTLKYYAKRPPVSQVVEWIKMYDKLTVDNWRGLPDSYVKIERAQNIPYYYKLTFQTDGKKRTRYYYGELAWHKLVNFVGDLGHYIERG